MTDFSKFSEEDILQFIDKNFSLFSSERNDKFPENVRTGLTARTKRFVVPRCKEGFAVAYQGRRNRQGDGFYKANLMFLFVLPEFEGTGIGKKLLEEVKKSVTPGLPIELKCEGIERMEYFTRRGFAITDHSPEGDHYEMIWQPPFHQALQRQSAGDAPV